jgi:hypothetical protein
VERLALFFGKGVSMFSLNAGSATKPRFALPRALAVSLCLVTAFLFLGCPMGGGGGGDDTAPQLSPPNFTGTWASQYGDKYVITSSKLTYDSGFPDFDLEGPIAEIVPFTSTAGVIIFQYTKTPSHETHLMGKYNAVYYKDFETNSARMGAAWDSSKDETPSADTLQAAKTKFTADKTGTYFGKPGAYSKK